MSKQKQIVKHKTLIVCGDWNINFIQTSPHTRDLNNMLLRYNLKHTVNVPTRITKTTATLLDVVITNEKKSKLLNSYGFRLIRPLCTNYIYFNTRTQQYTI